jgi:hypothetical protein
VIDLLESAAGIAGNLVTDAQIGALALAYRAVVHTADRDFLRFSEVRCHFPLDDQPRSACPSADSRRMITGCVPPETSW